MYRHIKPSSRRNLCVFAFFESPERCCRPEENASHDDASRDRAAFAVAARALNEFQRNFCAINSSYVLHHPRERSGTSPTATFLRFCHSRGGTCAARDDGSTVDYDRMDQAFDLFGYLSPLSSGPQEMFLTIELEDVWTIFVGNIERAIGSDANPFRIEPAIE